NSRTSLIPSRSASLRTIEMLSRCSAKRRAIASRWSISSSSRGIWCIFVIERSKKPIGSFMKTSISEGVTGRPFGFGGRGGAGRAVEQEQRLAGLAQLAAQVVRGGGAPVRERRGEHAEQEVGEHGRAHG